MRKKTVLYLRTDSDAKDLIAGGSVAHTIGVINGFANQGYTVVCASSALVSIMPQLPIHNFLLLTMPSWVQFLGNKGCAFLSTIFFAFQVAPFFRTYDIEFIYQRYTLLNCTGIILSWWYGKNLILEFNSSKVWTEMHWSPNKKIKMRFFVLLCEKINIAYAHKIIAVSDAIKNLLIKVGVTESRIIVNPNGVDTELFDPCKLQKDRRKIRTDLGLSGKYVFGFIGTFSYWHDVEQIVDVIPRVYVLCPKSHFLLIGNGPLFDYVQKKIEENRLIHSAVTLTGMVPQHSAPKYLAACDAFLSLTKPNPDGTPFFGSPTKLFEYMSLGKPIIASDLDQIAQVIQPAFTLHDILMEEKLKNTTKAFHIKKIPAAAGILIPPGNTTALAQAACWIFRKNYAFQKRLGTHARARASAYYTWNHHVEKIINASR
jgi:glycosyltransferase involved in cell wall biosynthesis